MVKAEALEVINENSTPTQRELGAYYTPDSLTAILSEWAIQSATDYVFEPSFGGCGFLESAVTRLSKLGCSQPGSQLSGCDIDPNAFDHLSRKISTIGNIQGRFLQKDFMEATPEDFAISSYSALIANPPYISLHNLSATQKKSIGTWLEKHRIKISKRASLWAYFVLHATSFLMPGGRMAWVLPGSFLHADYGIEVQKFLLKVFGQVHAIKLGERVFLSEGTEERTVIVLCEDYGQSIQNIIVDYAESLTELTRKLTAEPQEDIQIPQETDTENDDLTDGYSTVVNGSNVTTIGDIATVLIGTVTGANNFFVLNPLQAAALGIEKRYLHPILSKFSNIQGFRITANDFRQWKTENYRCFIFHVSDESRISDAAKAYADTFDENEKKENKTFKKRGDWLAADDRQIPDAFLSYMNHYGPRLVLNEARVNSTNSIHRVTFRDHVTPLQKKLAIISLCTTFSQLSAENEGRSYGSGVLKHEPSDAKKIKLVMPENKSEEEVDKAFQQIDMFYRERKLESVQKCANEFIFGANNEGLFNKLSESLKEVRKQRMR